MHQETIDVFLIFLKKLSTFLGTWLYLPICLSYKSWMCISSDHPEGNNVIDQPHFHTYVIITKVIKSSEIWAIWCIPSHKSNLGLRKRLSALGLFYLLIPVNPGKKCLEGVFFNWFYPQKQELCVCSLLVEGCMAQRKWAASLWSVQIFKTLLLFHMDDKHFFSGSDWMNFALILFLFLWMSK